jgi:hypothetical protein
LKKIIFRLSKKGNGIENAWLYDLAILQKQKKEAMTECVNLPNIEKKIFTQCNYI